MHSLLDLVLRPHLPPLRLRRAWAQRDPRLAGHRAQPRAGVPARHVGQLNLPLRKLEPIARAARPLDQVELAGRPAGTAGRRPAEYVHVASGKADRL